MRITQKAVTLTSLQGLNRNLEAVGKLQQQLTSGRLINAPSDSPTGTNKAMQTRSEQAAVEQFGRNISDADSWLSITDSTLQSMLDVTRRVRDLTVQGASTGNSSAASRQALATEVASLRESLLGLANTTIQGRPVFGGVGTGGKAYDSDTGAYQGLAGAAGADVMRRVSFTEQVRVDITGPEAFGPAGDDLFALVGRIADDLVNDPAALAQGLDDLDVAMKRMLSGVADVGARAARVEREQQINSDLALTLETELGEVENVDLPNTIMRLQMQQVGYQAALQATAKAISPTLMDYLR
ncbi:flagellar hook-associated protein FlgL [Blastococcus xanthinilyticus]|uniref:Flagellar hook-associated protein 3 FlgL n=1 Tax=Blastococcus xanthinilyticus TaxID=1564164 RepID=A0A5S5CRE3_9ACTN|nr:flagellar hook-associated protein FlgL [Blastococcus xanthinilyticus]TYP86310.1 flagellar hook-associated protein 3 FlgL [Blastococcus xanthinilyticus]